MTKYAVLRKRIYSVAGGLTIAYFLIGFITSVFLWPQVLHWLNTLSESVNFVSKFMTGQFVNIINAGLAIGAIPVLGLISFMIITFFNKSRINIKSYYINTALITCGYLSGVFMKFLYLIYQVTKPPRYVFMSNSRDISISSVSFYKEGIAFSLIAMLLITLLYSIKRSNIQSN